jgi:transposase
MPKRLSNEKVNSLKQALTEPTSAYDIAKETGVHESTVSRYFRRLFSNRTINTGGRPTIVSKVTKWLIERKFIEGVLKTAKEVHRELVQLGYDISYQSAIKVLKSMEFHFSTEKKKLFLRRAHM